MTEHRHDPDLILALAAGTAPAAGPVAAEVAACGQCAADLAMQRIALDALATIPPARLGSDERAGLRRHLLTELHLEETPSPAGAAPSPGRSRRRPLWGLATAAAVFLAIVAVPPAFRALSPSDDGPVFEAAVGTTSTADESDAALSAPGPDTGRAGADPETVPELPGDDGGVDTFATEHDGATQPDTAAATSLPVIVLADPGDGSAELKDLEESGGSLPAASGAPRTMVAEGTIAACREVVAGGAAGYPLAVTEVDGVPALVMAYPGEEGTSIALQSLDDCRVLGTAAP